MLVLMIIGVILVLVVMTYAVITANKYSLKKYQYKPFNIKTCLFMLIPSFTFLSQFMFLQNNTATFLLAFEQGNLNIILLTTTSLLLVLGFVYYLTKKTNIWIAIFTTIVQFAIAFLIAVIIILRLMGRNKKQIILK
ncbi:hypothetical protein [Candidatus Spongiihabitans sp.]|uniref:hypothetical protein n=1 Tax=Candidatus Spongiihabitans sp. TaxID=3101308 RepID=UPI003C7B2E27